MRGDDDDGWRGRRDEEPPRSMSFVSDTLVAFGSLLSIVDPFAAVPIFLVLTVSQPPPARTRTALRAAATCFFVLTTFALVGGAVFSFFGITLPAFKITGGFLVFGVGFEMIRAKQSGTRSTEEEATEAATKDDVAVVPLGLPLLSGPGAIATVIVLAGKAPGVEHRLSLGVAIAAVSLIAALVLMSAETVSRLLGTTGINIVGRVMGLILAAIAIQLMIDGVHEAFPAFGGFR
jgi:multiple antibiotic resistance protein